MKNLAQNLRNEIWHAVVVPYVGAAEKLKDQQLSCSITQYKVESHQHFKHYGTKSRRRLPKLPLPLGDPGPHHTLIQGSLGPTNP